MNRIFDCLVASAAVLSLLACSPSSYDTDEADLEAEKVPHFTFSVEHCENQSTGRFTFSHPTWDIPIDMAGDVVNFAKPEAADSECRFYAHLEYESLHPSYPGSGRATACFVGDYPCSEIWVTVETGPYQKYKSEEPIQGELETCGCGESQ